MWPFDIGAPVIAPPLGPLVALDDTNMTSSLALTGLPWVNPANDIWSGTPITRYNAQRVCNWPNYSARSLQFQAISLPVSPSVGGDPFVAVAADGVLVTTVPIAIALSPIQYTVDLSGLAPGPHHIQLVDAWQSRTSAFDDGADAPICGTYLTGVRVPIGQPLPIKATTTAVAITCDTDSTGGGTSNEPFAWFGWPAQVRRVAEASGGLLACFTIGGSCLCGDGLTAAQRANVHDLLFTAMGTPAQPVHIVARVPNDARTAYWIQPGSVQQTPAQYGVYLGAELDALRAARPGLLAFVVNPPFPISHAEVGPNPGNYYRQLSDGVGAGQYYTSVAAAIAARSGWCFGIDCSNLNFPADYADAVHPNQAGQNKVAADVVAALRAQGVAI